MPPTATKYKHPNELPAKSDRTININTLIWRICCLMGIPLGYLRFNLKLLYQLQIEMSDEWVSDVFEIAMPPTEDTLFVFAFLWPRDR